MLQNRVIITIIALLYLSTRLFGQVKGTLFQRAGKLSNFEFAIDNDGTLWGKNYPEYGNPFAPRIGFWPRNSYCMQPQQSFGGMLFLAKKNGKYLSSDAGFLPPFTKLAQGVHEDNPFFTMVPGRIGDEKAGYDSVFRGSGWRYVDDPDYIVYSSLDYNTQGVDISGSNFNDWPIRNVNGGEKYVSDPLSRRNYPPVFHSDEEMFLVFKDTDTRTDDHYTGPDGWSVPIGIEVHNYVYSWKEGAGANIVVLRYDVINKSGTQLDSCFIAYGSGLLTTDALGTGLPLLAWYTRWQPWRNLMYVQPTHLDVWAKYWKASEGPPLVGLPFLETPRGYQKNELGLTYATSGGLIQYYVSPDGQLIDLYSVSDSLRYVMLTRPTYRWFTSQTDSLVASNGPAGNQMPVLISGPFPVAPNDTARFAVSYIFSDDFSQLLLMDDYVQKVYDNGLHSPSPPPAARVSAKALNQSVDLSWDSSAESATDIVIPDSLGKPFAGYRLLRADKQTGPFNEIARWQSDSLVHEYLDRGTEVGGLKNNVRYYYHLLSFNEGVRALNLDTMESPVVEGVNSISVIPSTEPSNAGSSEGSGALMSGTLGDVSPPQLIPENATNYNNLISGRELKVAINATTDGTRYLLPVSISDSVSGRVHNSVIDVQLLINGSPQTAGIKEGTGIIKDIFGIGAADLTLRYSFEQLSEPFHISPSIESNHGADVPIIIDDSLKATGILIVTPYTTAAKQMILEFTGSGYDTAGTFPVLRVFKYLNVKLTDAATDTEYQRGVDWVFASTGVMPANGLTFSDNHGRYYLSGTLANGEYWEFGSTLNVYQSEVGFDYPDRGRGSGKSGPLFSWASSHRAGTRDFDVGDKVLLTWQGGVKAVFPRNAQVRVTGGTPTSLAVSDAMMNGIHIVPNPYFISHDAQRGSPVLYFNYLPDQCTIRIYTVALDLVRTIVHNGGSREEWDLQTTGGQLVASQMLFAYIEAPNGRKVIKKFSVIVGK